MVAKGKDKKSPYKSVKYAIKELKRFCLRLVGRSYFGRINEEIGRLRKSLYRIKVTVHSANAGNRNEFLVSLTVI